MNVNPSGSIRGSGTTNRALITGVDAAGRSCAAQDDPITLQGGDGLDGILYAVLYATPSLPSISTGGGRSPTFSTWPSRPAPCAGR